MLTRQEANAIYDAGRETVVHVLPINWNAGKSSIYPNRSWKSPNIKVK